MPGSFYAALERAAAVRAQRPAFTFLGAGAKTYTFAELFDAARDIARRIEQQGLDAADSPLGILLRSQEGQTLHYLAALAAGAVPAILTPPNRKLNREYYAVTMAEVLRRSRFHALISDVDDLSVPVATYAPDTLERSSAAPTRTRDDAGSEVLDASFLQFSSGTTGIKRGVLVRDEAVLAQLHAYADALELTEEDRIVSWLPLYHDMGFIACLNMPLLFGLHTIVIDPIDWVTRPALLLQAASHFGGTLSWNPNFAYAFMAQRVRDADLDELDLSSLRGLVNCSEPVTHASQQQFLRRFSPLGLRHDVFMGCYAMAETTFALTHGPASDPTALDHVGPTSGARSRHADPYVSVGRPIARVDLEVMDDRGRPRPDREIGELWVRSPFNFTGYYGDRRATEAAFVGDWYRTGDLGYRVGNDFFVTGRSKDVLIVGGVNVFPHDLEEVAGRVEGVLPGRTVAFARFDEARQTERVTILAESDRQGEAGRETLLRIRQWIQSSFDLAAFEVHLVPPGWLVKSSSGKIARSANREKWQGSGEMVIYHRDHETKASRAAR
jgi:fatty-acyl-CoA synthase